MKPKIKHPRLNSNSQPELAILADRVGQFIEYWGFKAVQGRMWCYLYLSDTPLSSIQLAQLLKVSPALVTQSVQVLIQYRVILEAEKGPNGVLRFQANPNVAEAIAGVLSGREAVMMNSLSDAAERLKQYHKQTPTGAIALNSTRIKKIEEWIALAGWLLEAGIAGLSARDNPFEKPDNFRDQLEKYL